MRADDVLAQIDTTLDDWAVSDDAMRSRPKSATSPSTVYVAGEGGQWQEIGTVASFEFVVDTSEFEQQWQAARERIIRLQVERAQRIQAAMDEALAAMAEALKPPTQAAHQGITELVKALQRPARDSANARRQSFQHIPEADGCNGCGPKRHPRDRPAWQSPYGPPRRR